MNLKSFYSVEDLIKVAKFYMRPRKEGFEVKKEEQLFANFGGLNLLSLFCQDLD